MSQQTNISMNKVMLFIKIVLIVLFIGCLFDWNYGYYQLVRFVGMVVFGLLAYYNYQQNKTWFLIWLSSAVLINPIFKIALGRELWNVIDIIWAILLIISMFYDKQTELRTKKNMNLKEAQDLLQKLKPLENKATTQNEFLIHKFFIIPLKFIRENNIEIDWYKFWKNEYAFQKNIDSQLDYDIVAVHKSSYSTFFTSTNLKHFKSLL